MPLSLMFDRTIIKNISSLFSIQIASYIIPLITLPYLVRTLGVEGFGYLSFSLAITQYAILLINYGFDLSATSSIAKCRDNINKVSEIFWNVLTIRLLSFGISFLLIGLAALLSETILDIKHILFSAMSIALGAALFPQWLFQGKEQLGLVSIARVITQILTIPFLLFFVSSPKDVWIAALISGASSLIIAVYALVLVYRRGWVVFTFPKVSTLKQQLAEGWYIFISTAAISLYTTSVTVILGFISGPISVGYFVAADRVIKAVLGLYGTVSNAFYPRINAVVEKSKIEARELVVNLGKLITSIAFFCSLGVFIFAEIVVKILFGSEHQITANILQILSLLPIVISISNLMGIQILIPFGYKNEFSKVIISAGCISLILLIPSIYLYAEYGAAVSVILTEILVTGLMTHKVIKLKILKVKK